MNNQIRIKSIRWAVFSFALIGAQSLLVRIAQTYFSSSLPMLAVTAVTGLSLLFAALVLGIYRLVESKIFRGIQAETALKTISQDLSGAAELSEVVDTILAGVKKNMSARKAALLLLEKNTYALHGQYGMSSFRAEIPIQHVIVQYLRDHRRLLQKGQMQQELKSSYSTAKKIEAALDWLGVVGVVPFIEHGQLIGMLLVGGRQDNKPYSKNAWAFLSQLAAHSSVALERARLYKELQDYEADLQAEIKQATQELEQANTQLKTLDKAKSEFLSIASHQLYTPLTALRGYISMLLEGDFGKVPEKQQEILQLVKASATRLIELNKFLLDISRIESGRLDLNLESADLVSLTVELVQDLLPNAIEKGLTLEFHQPKQPVPPVAIDRERIRQVMLNFIDNAIKYTEKGRVEVRVGREGDEVIFSVQDTGKGISKDDISRLFNKFTRVGGASRFHTEGTGLGLYVARQIVKEHHGEVHVDSPGEGLGSTFAMSVPVEGTPRALKIGEKAEVVIKAAEVHGQRRVRQRI